MKYKKRVKHSLKISEVFNESKSFHTVYCKSLDYDEQLRIVISTRKKFESVAKLAVKRTIMTQLNKEPNILKLMKQCCKVYSQLYFNYNVKTKTSADGVKNAVLIHEITIS